jgi:hypothetical protein
VFAAFQLPRPVLALTKPEAKPRVGCIFGADVGHSVRIATNANGLMDAVDGDGSFHDGKPFPKDQSH